MTSAPFNWTYYLAGPMTGVKNFNYPAFEEAQRLLRLQGYTVESPHEASKSLTEDELAIPPRALYVHHGLELLLKCNAVALLPGWQNSPGVMLELHVATACGYPLFSYSPLRNCLYKMS